MTLHFRGDIQEEADRSFRFRELIRGNGHRSMPNGRDGFVVEDLDLVLRWKGRKFGLDDVGRFRLIEVKRRGNSLGWSKIYTFGLIDAICRLNPRRYDGFYLVEHDDDDFNESTTFWVSNVELTADEFLDWCLSPRSAIPPHSWSKRIVP